MTNTAKLAAMVEKSGLTTDYIAYRLKTTEKDFLTKAAGIKPFTVSEVETLKSILSLTGKETTEIFFCNLFGDYCKEHAITQEELAELLGIKSAAKQLNGDKPFTVGQVVTICKHYGISAETYFC